MYNEEHDLIKNLFFRLKKTETNSGEIDKSANKLIKNFLKEQSNAPYYMAQTLLIQEEAIKKLNFQVDELKHKNKELKNKIEKNNTGFLSGLFKNKNNNIDYIDQKKLNNNYSKYNQDQEVNNSAFRPSGITSNNVSGGFLKNALQTAAGVAGGMIVANTLNNLFHNKNLENNNISENNSVSTSNDKKDDLNNINEENSENSENDDTYIHQNIEEITDNNFDLEDDDNIDDDFV
ncbi:DUF2076 domain-containing protein [Buchnera aphidicola (Taiwanaphis decaspermi)]|uniref:DUF2076 domain-containing protein n=1 Tax=Buchnera aphidicola TaxID=9 RepID=UPI0031B80416